MLRIKSATNIYECDDYVGGQVFYSVVVDLDSLPPSRKNKMVVFWDKYVYHRSNNLPAIIWGCGTQYWFEQGINMGAINVKNQI